MRYLVWLLSVALWLMSAATRTIWWLLCLPFIAFEAMGNKVVRAPRDDATPREDLRRDRDLLIKAMIHTPPPQG